MGDPVTRTEQATVAAEVMSDGARVPCPKCGTAILLGARKCKGCKSWLGEKPRRRSRFARSFTLVAAAVITVASVLISSRESPVGEAPPLTPIGSAPSETESPVKGDPSPAALGPDVDPRAPEPLEATTKSEAHEWTARQLQLDVHPLDLAFSPDGNTVYVSADDASLREYELKRGKLVHMASLPAQGDTLRVLHDRFVAVLRDADAVHIPVMDTHNWDRDPMLLWAGLNPADIVAMPDGRTAIAASNGGKRLTWWDLINGRRLGNIRLPHATTRLYLLHANGQSLVGAMGTLYRGEQAAGAWMDLFDPAEEPFGATRRSISVGRDPRQGTVTHAGEGLFFVDHVSNSASLLRIESTTHIETTTVGQGPVAAFTLSGRYGITLDSGSKTATIVDLKKMERLETLALDGEPRGGVVSPDGNTLVVSLGGNAWPPRESGSVVIEGDPPKVVANLPTGQGASRVAITKDGTRAVVANYADKSLTLIER